MVSLQLGSGSMWVCSLTGADSEAKAHMGCRCKPRSLPQKLCMESQGAGRSKASSKACLRRACKLSISKGPHGTVQQGLFSSLIYQ